MKVLFLILGMSTIIFVHGQRNYAKAIEQGDSAFKKGEYKLAINKYFAAEAFDPSKKDTVKKKVNIVFDMIETLRKKAEDAEIKATKSKKEAEDALTKANNLIAAFYFYRDRFALTLGDYDDSDDDEYEVKYFFIDKNGKKLRTLGSWDQAEPFNILSGLAKVIDEEDTFLLDTAGKRYRLAFNLDRMKENTTALDLSADSLSSFPSTVLDYEQLKILILGKLILFDEPKNIRILPANIDKLRNLEYLDLAVCNIDSLPSQITNLKYLWGLNLEYSGLTKLPDQFSDLQSLTTLYLGGSKFDNHKIPPQIFKLTNLTTLALDENRFDSLPSQIQYLKNLTWLVLENNWFPDIPSEIGTLKSLKKLILGSNKISKLPPEIGHLKELEELDLNNNQLTRLPIEIGNLKKLKRLDLGSNAIQKSEQDKIKRLLPNCQIDFGNQKQ